MTLDEQIKRQEEHFAFVQGRRDAALKDYDRQELKLQMLRKKKTLEKKNG